MEYISSPAHISQYLRTSLHPLTLSRLGTQKALMPCLLKGVIVAILHALLLQHARYSPAACSYILCKGVHRRSRLLRQATHSLV